MISSKPRPTTLTINNIKLTVEIADDLSEQTKGLSGRDSLCANCGMLFVYDQPKIQTFWMRDMKFPLDIIFIRDHKIVEVVENVPAPKTGQDIPRVQSHEQADMVLELNAGFVQKNSILMGNQVRM